MAIRISSLDRPQTGALLNFCLECGCNSFELRAVADNWISREFIDLFESPIGKSPFWNTATIRGKLDRKSTEILAACFKNGLLPPDGLRAGADIAIWCAERSCSNIQLQTFRSDSSVVLRFSNDLQAEALYRIGIRFQCCPDRPDLRPEEPWITYDDGNLYLYAPGELSLNPQCFDKERWAGRAETYGHDWYNTLENEHLGRWWSAQHDDKLREAIRKHGWAWSPPIETLIGLTPAEEIARWKEEDFRCRRWSWYNVLNNYAVARAKELRLTEGAFPEPTWLRCSMCDHVFHQSRLWRKWLSHEQAVICPLCFAGAVWNAPVSQNRDRILEYLQKLAAVIQEIPHSDFGQKPDDFAGLSPVQVVNLMRILKDRPAVAQVKELFGSWFAALVAAGLLPDGSQQMARGVRCVAEDGHLCLSLGEKTICDILHRYGIPHEREVTYPGLRGFRADWAVGETLIEYFGLAGDPGYDERIKAKRKLAMDHGLTMIAIYPKDLAKRSSLLKKLGIDVPRPLQSPRPEV